MKPIPKPLLTSMFLLGILLFGISNVIHVYSLGSTERAQLPAANAGLPTTGASITPSPTTGVPLEATRLPTLPVLAATAVSNPLVYAFIEAPRGALQYPYVTLSGFHSGSFTSQISLTGTVNVTDFTCPGSPCTLPLELGESRVIFKAVLSTGESSDTVIALVWAEQKPDGYHVTIESVSQYMGIFADACLADWGITDETYPSWAEFPRYPYELNTQVSLHNLSAQLIIHGMVDTTDCPAGGMSQDLTWPNGCGMERARDKMIEWQNQYDEAFWTAASEVGIPPRILKTLVQIESQFWPANSRFYMDEFGLGQVNELGVDVLLRRDPQLYQQACSAVLTHCDTPYMGLSPVEQSMVRAALLTSQDASCPTCENGLDLTKSKQSIHFIAQVLRANCQQVKTTLESRSATTDYESYWKFTLLSYHSGMSCFSDAVKATKNSGQSMNWENLAEKLNCRGGEDYVDGFWTSLTSFDAYRIASEPAPLIQYSPVFMPTRTPLPSPTPMTSQARVWVGVYMDSNADGLPQAEEGLDAIPVQLEFPDGRIVSAVTEAGEVSFDMSGEIIGTRIVVSLPGLYRESIIYLPESGTTTVLFMFTEPVLPKSLP